MPKMKTHKGLARRVKVTARKKIMRKCSYSGHLMSGKSGRRRQQLRRKRPILTALVQRYLRALCAE